jgi:hypothetical protein
VSISASLIFLLNPLLHPFFNAQIRLFYYLFINIFPNYKYACTLHKIRKSKKYKKHKDCSNSTT